jgi:hypothetical protein
LHLNIILCRKKGERNGEREREKERRKGREKIIKKKLLINK